MANFAFSSTQDYGALEKCKYISTRTRNISTFGNEASGARKLPARYEITQSLLHVSQITYTVKHVCTYLQPSKPSVHLSLRETKMQVHSETCTHLFRAVFFSSPNWSQSKFLSSSIEFRLN